jgi:hypothetical protein
MRPAKDMVNAMSFPPHFRSVASAQARVHRRMVGPDPVAEIEQVEQAVVVARITRRADLVLVPDAILDRGDRHRMGAVGTANPQKPYPLPSMLNSFSPMAIS